MCCVPLSLFVHTAPAASLFWAKVICRAIALVAILWQAVDIRLNAVRDYGPSCERCS